jgi:hypothetical protein
MFKGHILEFIDIPTNRIQMTVQMFEKIKSIQWPNSELHCHKISGRLTPPLPLEPGANQYKGRPMIGVRIPCIGEQPLLCSLKRLRSGQGWVFKIFKKSRH